MQQLWSCAEIDTFVLLWPNCSMFMCGICCNCQKYLNYTCILRMRQAHWLKLAKTWLGLHSECGWLLSRNPLHFILLFKGLICESWIPIWKLLWTPLITWTFELLSKLLKFLRIWHICYNFFCHLSFISICIVFCLQLLSNFRVWLNNRNNKSLI